MRCYFFQLKFFLYILFLSARWAESNQHHACLHQLLHMPSWMLSFYFCTESSENMWVCFAATQLPSAVPSLCRKVVGGVDTAIPSPFSLLAPHFFSFILSRSQRQTQARRGKQVNPQLLNSRVPVETVGQMGPTPTQTQTKAFSSIGDFSPTCILMRGERREIHSPSQLVCSLTRKHNRLRNYIRGSWL